MIEIFGANEGQEYVAACRLRDSILELWPDIQKRQQDKILIYAGLKCYGEYYQDIDLFVVGELNPPREFKLLSDFQTAKSKKTAQLKSFSWVIEEKSHDARGVKFAGQHAEVRYNGQWFGVTEKNDKQKYSVKNFLEKKLGFAPWLTNFIWFTNLKESDLPKRPHGMFGSDCSFERLLNIHAQNVNRDPYQGAYNADSGKFETSRLIKNHSSIFAKLEPTSLDRRKMDQIVKRDRQIEQWVEEIGIKQVNIQGRGGVGKTVILQQMAYKMYEEHDKRSLILTYNQALVADIQRCMSHLGIGDSLQSGAIKVRTVNGFIADLLNKLGFLSIASSTTTDHGYPKEKIANAKRELLEFLDEGAFKKQERRSFIETIDSSKRENFAWDYIFIDEGQDWPQDEIKILQSLYGPERLIIADGVDQFVRPHHANWSPSAFGAEGRKRRLRRCMRMKRNLATFVSSFAEELGLVDWDLEPNPDANGGSIKIYEGDLANRFDKFIWKIHNHAKENGNEMVDLLGCVPPSLVRHDTSPASLPAKLLEKTGIPVWDASSSKSKTRGGFPTSVDQFRIVQYESCRGLEGWGVVNFALDLLYDYKYRLALKEEFGSGDMLVSAEEYARRKAAQWTMIPLTRAMDTLILNVSQSDSSFKSQLKSVAERYPDFIEWHKI